MNARRLIDGDVAATIAFLVLLRLAKKAVLYLDETLAAECDPGTTRTIAAPDLRAELSRIIDEIED